MKTLLEPFTAVKENTVPYAVRQIQPLPAIAELVNNSQAVEFMMKAPFAGSQFAQDLLTGMGKRRMSDIMTQADSFCQLRIKVESLSVQPLAYCCCDSRDMKYMLDPCADMIVLWREEYLCLVLQPAERGGMDDGGLVSEVGASNVLIPGMEPG
jgi:hypothetical protein